jgi:hypothetical protein
LASDPPLLVCLAVADITPAIRNPTTIQAEPACGCTLK